MNSIDEALSNLICAINNDEDIKRLHELESIIDNDFELKSKFSRLKEVQKELVNARYYKKDNTRALEKELSSLKEEIKDLPLVSEYTDLLDIAYNILLDIKDILENELNKSI